MSRRRWLALAGGAAVATAVGGISVPNLLRSREIEKISRILRTGRVEYLGGAQGEARRKPVPNDEIRRIAAFAYFMGWRATPLNLLITQPDFPSRFSYEDIDLPVKTHLVAIPPTKAPSVSPIDFGIDSEGGYINIVLTARAPTPAVQKRLFQFGRRFFAEYARAEVLADKPLIIRGWLTGHYLLREEFREVLIRDFIERSHRSLPIEVAEEHLNDEMFFLNLTIAHAWGAGNRFLDRDAVEFLARNFWEWRFDDRYPTREQMEQVLRVILTGDLSKLNLSQLALYHALGQKYGFEIPSLAQAIEAAGGREAVDYFYDLTQTYSEQFDQAETFFGPETIPT